MRTPPILRRLRPALVLTFGALALFAAPAVAHAGEPGAVFTQTNTVPNSVAVFQRAPDGTLAPAGQVATGGAGRPAGNPPLGFPTLDSGRNVELSSDGDGRHCLFVTNAGSNTVSSLAFGPKGLTLADQAPTNGSRPISLTSTQRGPMNVVLYVLNSDFGAASIQGYYVSGTCGLTPIPGSFHLTSTPESIPANIAFNERGTALAVSERFANGFGDLDVFPVGPNGVAGAPVVSPSLGMTPYGLAWDNHDHLTVSNENVADLAMSTVSSYRLTKDDTLEPINVAPSPGAACWNVITSNGKFLYVTGPAAQLVGGHSVSVFSVANDGSLTPTADGQDTPYNAIDDALSHDSKFLYVLSDQLLPVPAPLSAISEYAVDANTGALTPIGSVALPSNTTAGLAAW